jgi:hypothetical protein
MEWSEKGGRRERGGSGQEVLVCVRACVCVCVCLFVMCVCVCVCVLNGEKDPRYE